MSNTDETKQRWIRMRFPGRCRLCGGEVAKGAKALYEPSNSTIRCFRCVAPTQPALSTVPPAGYQPRGVTEGSAGTSAMREYERRRAKDEQRVSSAKQASPRQPGERHSTRSWRVGADGEKFLGRVLNHLQSEGIYTLHDRRLKGKRANIDHIVITRGRIWVVDAKKYRGKVTHRRVGGMGRRSDALLVGDRDVTQLLASVQKQADIVRSLVGTLPVTPALCFVDADWPSKSAGFNIGHISVVPPESLVSQLRVTNAGNIDTAGLHNYLSVELRPA